MNPLSLLAIFSFASFAPAQARLLFDDFNDNSLDPARWTVDDRGHPTNRVNEVNQRLEFENTPVLVTADEFPGASYGIVVECTWTPAISLGSFLFVRTRTDGGSNGIEAAVLGSALGGQVGYQLSIRSQAGVTFANLRSNSFSDSFGGSYRVRVADLGSTVSLSVSDLGGNVLASAAADVVSDSTTDRHVAFMKVFDAMYLDDVTIHSPEPVVGVGCPGESAPRIVGVPSANAGFSVACPAINLPCFVSPVLLFGACSATPIQVPPPLGCHAACALHLDPTWGSSGTSLIVPSGLPLGFEFCVQCGCIAAPQFICIDLTNAVRVVVEP